MKRSNKSWKTFADQRDALFRRAVEVFATGQAKRWRGAAAIAFRQLGPELGISEDDLTVESVRRLRNSRRQEFDQLFNDFKQRQSLSVCPHCGRTPGVA